MHSRHISDVLSFRTATHICVVLETITVEGVTTAKPHGGMAQLKTKISHTCMVATMYYNQLVDYVDYYRSTSDWVSISNVFALS